MANRIHKPDCRCAVCARKRPDTTVTIEAAGVAVGVVVDAVPTFSAQTVLAAVAAGQRVRLTKAEFAALLAENLEPDERMELRQRERRTEILVEDR